MNIFHEAKIFNNLITCGVTSISLHFAEKNNCHIAFQRVYSRKYNFRKIDHMCGFYRRNDKIDMMPNIGLKMRFDRDRPG